MHSVLKRVEYFQFLNMKLSFPPVHTTKLILCNSAHATVVFGLTQ